MTLYKELLQKQFYGARKRLDQYVRDTAREKIQTVFDSVIQNITGSGSGIMPVDTGQFLASFRVSTHRDGVDAGPMGPKAWKGKFDAAISAANRQKAVTVVQRNYDRSIFNNPYQNFYLTNGAPHAGDLEYGGGNDFTKGAHRGIVKTVWTQALNEAQLSRAKYFNKGKNKKVI